jgi:hypothetical protein
MSLIYDKNNNKKTGGNQLTIDEIANQVSKWNYSIENVSTENKSIEVNKNKVLKKEDIQKENLRSLVDLLMKLEDCKIDSSQSNTQISKLYNLLKEKLNQDINKLNLRLLVKFLRFESDSKVNKLSTTIKGLFNAILEDVRDKLNKNLSKNGFTILEELFDEEIVIESRLKAILSSIQEKESINSKEYESKNKVQIATEIYLFVVLKNYDSVFFFRELSIFERVMSEYLADIERKQEYKYLLKDLPEILAKNEPKLKIRSLLLVYFRSHVLKLETDVSKLKDELYETTEANKVLSFKLKEKSAKIAQINLKINELQQKDLENIETINSLNAKLSSTIDRHEYETNKYDTHLQGLKTGIITGLQNNLKLDISNLTDLANELNPDDKRVLNMIINSINQKLNNL